MEMAKLKPKKQKEEKPAVPKFVPLKPDPEAYANFGKGPPQGETDAQKKMRAEIIAKQKAAAAAAAAGGPGINTFDWNIRYNRYILNIRILQNNRNFI